MANQDNTLERKQKLFWRALDHELRMQIINFIKDVNTVKQKGPSVNQITEHCGREQSVVSQHLTILKEQDIISFTQDGKSHLYFTTEKYESYIKSAKILSVTH